MTTAPNAAARASVSVTVDLAIFTVRHDDLHVLLITRGTEPYRGMSALPGGYVRDAETLDQAAVRELAEETGIDGTPLHLQQLRAYSDPGRDPRGRVITIAYLALGPDLPVPRAGTDAQDARWEPARSALQNPADLAFDHAAILREAVEKARSQLEYTTTAAAFCPEPFTITDLRRIYQAIWGVQLDPSNFRRKVTRTRHFIEPTGQRRQSGTGRPATLYRQGPAHLLDPPMLRANRTATTPAAPTKLASSDRPARACLRTAGVPLIRIEGVRGWAIFLSAPRISPGQTAYS
jgi:8-oxo-dGTP diphosphatase